MILRKKYLCYTMETQNPIVFREKPKERDMEGDVKGINVEFREETFWVEIRSLCTQEQLQQAGGIVEREIPSLMEALPEGHPWKEGKVIHRKVVQGEVQTIVGYFTTHFPPEYYELLSFLGGVHDLGRAIEAKKKLGMLPATYRMFLHHGEESANLLKDWGVTDIFEPDTQEIIRYATVHHADRETPSLPASPAPLDVLKHFYTSLVRDIDKLGIFRAKTDALLYDPTEKAKQIDVGGFEGEKRTIDPENLLDTFQTFRTLDRSRCRSYESVMLQYLAWIFDVNLPIVLTEVVYTGAIEKLLRYFAQQLREEQYRQIEETTVRYLKRFNLAPNL